MHASIFMYTSIKTCIHSCIHCLINVPLANVSGPRQKLFLSHSGQNLKKRTDWYDGPQPTPTSQPVLCINLVGTQCCPLTLGAQEITVEMGHREALRSFFTYLMMLQSCV